MRVVAQLTSLLVASAHFSACPGARPAYSNAVAGARANNLRGRRGSGALREPIAAASATGLLRDTRGAVFVEFLIAFLPVFTFFLCLVQLSLLFTVKVVTEHAAINAARAAAVIVADDPKSYGANERPNQLILNGERFDAIRDAALLTLSPLILNGTIDRLTVSFPPPGTPNGEGQTGTIHYTPMHDNDISKMRVRVEVDAQCRIAIANRIACTAFSNIIREALTLHPVISVRAEAVFPYQGAEYEYQP